MSNKNLQDKFNFFVPATFEKGTEEGSEDQVTKISGVCSSAIPDSDGETLFPEGFDFAPLLKTGLLNYNHRANQTSKAIVGEPTGAKVINDGKDFFLEGIIYPNEEGKAIVAQQEIFEKYSPNRRFGFSIEGQVIERGCGPEFLDVAKSIRNPNYTLAAWKQIKKARITGVAITPCPKNPNTLMSLVKGEYSEAFVSDEEENTDKAMEVDQDLTNHDVEGAKKKKKSEKVVGYLKKSDIYASILNRFHIDTIAKADQIYNYIVEYNQKINNMQKEQVTSDTLTKAFATLNELAKSQNTPTEQNTAAGAAGEEPVINAEVLTKCQAVLTTLVKAGMEKDTCIDTLTKGGFDAPVANKAYALHEEAETEGVKKSQEHQEVATTLKVEALVDIPTEINKAITPVTELIQKGFGSTEIILNSITEQNTLLKGEVDNLSKANENLIKENEKLSKAQEEFNKRLETLETTPNQRRSVTTAIQARERFEKSEDAQRAYPGCEIFNVSKKEDLNKLSDRIFAEIEVQKSKGSEPEAILEKAIEHIEMAQQVPQQAYARLRAMNIVLVTDEEPTK